MQPGRGRGRARVWDDKAARQRVRLRQCYNPPRPSAIDVINWRKYKWYCSAVDLFQEEVIFLERNMERHAENSKIAAKYDMPREMLQQKQALSALEQIHGVTVDQLWSLEEQRDDLKAQLRR